MVHVECAGELPAGMSKKLVGSLVETAYILGGGRELAEVSVSVVGDRKIRRLNREYRGEDRVTDVLSFGYGDRPDYDLSDKGKPTLQLGDILICLPQVKRQSRLGGGSLKDEFALLVVHGTLHLLGYDHATEKDERWMDGLERRALRRAGII